MIQYIYIYVVCARKPGSRSSLKSGGIPGNRSTLCSDPLEIFYGGRLLPAGEITIGCMPWLSITYFVWVQRNHLEEQMGVT